MGKIIISSNNNFSCLGHEINLTRFVIIDMLIQKFINENDIIVVRNNDNKFLYEKLFNNVLTFNEYYNLKKNNFDIIDLTPHSIYCAKDKLIIPNFQYCLNFNNEKFINNILNLKFCDINYNLSNDYVVIHHRYNDSLDNLIKICRKIIEKFFNLNIVIFNNNISTIQNINFFKNPNILFTDNLQMYASFLKNEKCQKLISEWSGGGQLSQYCMKKDIFYYINFYNSIGYCGDEEKLIKRAHSSYFDTIDWKNPINANIKIFKNLNDLLINI